MRFNRTTRKTKKRETEREKGLRLQSDRDRRTVGGGSCDCRCALERNPPAVLAMLTTIDAGKEPVVRLHQCGDRSRRREMATVVSGGQLPKV